MDKEEGMPLYGQQVTKEGHTRAKDDKLVRSVPLKTGSLYLDIQIWKLIYETL